MRLALLALLLCSAAQAAPPEQQWFTVLLDGRKIGSFQTQRHVQAGKVTTSQTLDIGLERAGIRIGLSSSESATETSDGKPLSFTSSSRMSGVESHLQGRIENGTATVTTNTAGVTQTKTLPWPKQALLPEAARLAGLRAGLAAGTHYRLQAFQPSSLEAVTVTTTVAGRESVDLPGGRRELTRVDQDLALPGTTLKSRSWVDAEQLVYKVTMPLMGVDLVMLACDRACATAPNQDSDVFDRSMLAAPQALAPEWLKRPMRYTLHQISDKTVSPLVRTDEQQVQVQGNLRIITVRPDAQPARTDERPTADDSKPNNWLQSTAPEVATLARKATADAQGAGEKMQRIEHFVRDYIHTKSLGVGYASALEVARKPEGDCTEHAILVAALGRAAGVATRVVTGFAYAPDFAGKQRVFVPHAWAQAWVDGRWRSYDAALNGFDSGHIALAVGDGDPWHFYAGLEQLGNLQMQAAEPVP